MSRFDFDQRLRDELIALAEEEYRVRDALAQSGELFASGHHPRLAEIHQRHGDRLRAVIAASGWPGRALVGEDGAEAAWRILQHAIGDPDLMRETLPLLRAAVRAGQAPSWQAAYVTDRIAFLEGRPQVYGTQMDWDEEGSLSPWTIEDSDGVDTRRGEVGLPPLAEQVAAARARAQAEGDEAPDDPRGYLAERRRWAEAAGWIPPPDEDGEH